MKYKMKKVGKFCMAFALAFIIFANTSSYVFASSDQTRNNSGYSYTRWVGPSVSSRYTFDISGNAYSGTKKNTIDYKDPTRVREGYVVYLKHGQTISGTYYNGSSTAYHRGYVQYGYVHVTA